MKWLRKLLEWLFGPPVQPIVDPYADEEMEPPLEPDEPQPA